MGIPPMVKISSMSRIHSRMGVLSFVPLYSRGSGNLSSRIRGGCAFNCACNCCTCCCKDWACCTKSSFNCCCCGGTAIGCCCNGGVTPAGCCCAVGCIGCVASLFCCCCISADCPPSGCVA